MTMHAEALKVYSLQLNDAGEIIGENDEVDERANLRLTNLAQQLAAEQGLDFNAALERVMSNPANAEAVRDYHLLANVGSRVISFEPPVQDDNPKRGRNGADDEIRELAEARMRDKNEKNFSKAVEAVLAKDPDLKAKYASCVGRFK